MAAGVSIQPRSSGRFESRFTDEGLFAAVGEVIAEITIAADAPVSTRRFDQAAKQSERHHDLPSARQIATRLHRSWPEVVAIAQGGADKPTARGAAAATSRAVWNAELDSRNLVLALNVIARELEQESVTRDEYRGTRRVLLQRAARDGRRRELERQLPTVAQIERLGGGEWNVALVAAGLGPRQGRELTDAGEVFAAQIRKEAGIAEFERGRTTKPPARRTKRRMIGSRQPPNGRSTREKREPLAKLARNGAQPRINRVSLPIAQGIAVFAESQQGWPLTGRVFERWTAKVNVSVQDWRRHDWEASVAAARALLAERGAVIPERELDHAVVNPMAPLPDGLPTRIAKRWTERDCIDGIKRFIGERGGTGERFTSGDYTAWPPGAHNAPWPSAFARYCGFAEIAEKARHELETECSAPEADPGIAEESAE